MNPGQRRAKRLIKRVPMWVSPRRPATSEQGVESMNISIRGAYFAAEGAFRVGEDIQVRLMMPEAVMPGQTTEWCFTGRVAHVTQLGTHGKIGVGVHFLYYTAGRQAGESLSSFPEPS